MSETVNPYKSTYLRLLNSIGKAAISALYPNDFEIYLCTLELVDSEGKSIQSLIFPVNPDSISEMNNMIVNIQKTNQGVSVLKTKTFIPVDISLSGNFGRRFRFLLGATGLDAAAVSFKSKQDEAEEGEPKEFSKQLKTGYGCTKVLEKLIKKSNTLDGKGNPYRLYFYNLAFGTSYLVVPLSIGFKQDMGTNMIWNYDLNMKAVAPLTGELAVDPKKMAKLIAFGTLQKVANTATRVLSNELKRQVIKKSTK